MRQLIRAIAVLSFVGWTLSCNSLTQDGPASRVKAKTLESSGADSVSALTAIDLFANPESGSVNALKSETLALGEACKTGHCRDATDAMGCCLGCGQSADQCTKNCERNPGAPACVDVNACIERQGTPGPGPSCTMPESEPTSSSDVAGPSSPLPSPEPSPISQSACFTACDDDMWNCKSTTEIACDKVCVQEYHKCPDSKSASQCLANALQCGNNCSRICSGMLPACRAKCTLPLTVPRPTAE